MLNKHKKLFSSGFLVPTSGIYQQVDSKGKKVNIIQYAMNKGKVFPPVLCVGYKWQLAIATERVKVI